MVSDSRHLPSLTYADANVTAPIILSAGSVAAKTYPVRGRTPRNQMYLIDFDSASSSQDPPRICAKVHAWNWATAVGWTDASRDSGLARETGFGEQGDPTQLVERISQTLAAAPARRLRWVDLGMQIPNIRFLIPDHLEDLIRRLERANIVVDYDICQVPSVLELRGV
jgi:hypothetical protein